MYILSFMKYDMNSHFEVAIVESKIVLLYELTSYHRWFTYHVIFFDRSQVILKY